MPKEIDDTTRALLTEVLKRCCGVVQCNDSALWLAEGDHLHPLLGYGPHSELFIGKYSHPLSEGLISMVYSSGQPFCENNIHTNPQHSSTLDQQLNIKTDAMIVMPIVFSGKINGVITCVHTSASEASENSAPRKEFTSADISELEFTTVLVGRILESATSWN